MDSLDFSLPPASTSVTDRRQHVRAYPTSASSLSPNGTRVVRLRLGGDDFVDPHSVRLQFTIVNNDTTLRLITTGGPWVFWSQVYLRSGGTELDNIPMYSRFHQQYLWNQLSQVEQFGEAGITGLHGSWHRDAEDEVPTNRPTLGGIGPNSSYTVMHKLGLSILNSGKLVPTRYMPQELELHLNPNLTDYLRTAYSTNFTLQNIQLIYDSYITDESVVDSFYRSLLSNRVLSMPIVSVFQTVHSIPAGSTSHNFAAVRAFSRLSHVWLTFRGTGPRVSEFMCPTATVAAQSGFALALLENAPSARLAIGPKYWPDPQPAATIPEHFYQLQKALPGIPNITRDNFMQDWLTIVFNLQKNPGGPTSSLSTRSGDLVSVFLTNLTPDRCTSVYMTMFAFSVAAVRESGVTLLT